MTPQVLQESRLEESLEHVPATFGGKRDEVKKPHILPGWVSSFGSEQTVSDASGLSGLVQSQKLQGTFLPAQEISAREDALLNDLQNGGSSFQGGISPASYSSPEQSSHLDRSTSSTPISPVSVAYLFIVPLVLGC